MVLSLAASARRGDQPRPPAGCSRPPPSCPRIRGSTGGCRRCSVSAQGRLRAGPRRRRGGDRRGDVDHASLGDADARYEPTRAALLEGEASTAAGRPDAAEKLLAALAMAREIDNPALLADAALTVAQRSPGAAPNTRPLARRAECARIQEVVPAELKKAAGVEPARDRPRRAHELTRPLTSLRTTTDGERGFAREVDGHLCDEPGQLDHVHPGQASGRSARSAASRSTTRHRPT